MLFTSPLRLSPEQQIALGRDGHGLAFTRVADTDADRFYTLNAATSNPPNNLRGLIEPEINPDCPDTFLLAAGLNKITPSSTAHRPPISWNLDYKNSAGWAQPPLVWRRVVITPAHAGSNAPVNVYVSNSDQQAGGIPEVLSGGISLATPERLREEFPYLFGDRPWAYTNLGAINRDLIGRVRQLTLPGYGQNLLTLGQTGPGGVGIMGYRRESNQDVMHNFTFAHNGSSWITRDERYTIGGQSLTDGTIPEAEFADDVFGELAFPETAHFDVRTFRSDAINHPIANSADRQVCIAYDFYYIPQCNTWGDAGTGERRSNGEILLRGEDVFSTQPGRTTELDSASVIAVNSSGVGGHARAIIPCGYKPRTIEFRASFSIEDDLDYYNVARVAATIVPSPVANVRLARRKRTERGITGRLHVTQESSDPIFRADVALRGVENDRSVQDLVALDALNAFSAWPSGLDRDFITADHNTTWRKGEFTRHCAVTRFTGVSGYQGYDTGPMEADFQFEESLVSFD